MSPKRGASWSSPTASPERRATRERQDKKPRFGSTILTLKVGQGSSSQPFSIHARIASKFSGFLAAALRNGWKESIDRVVRLPEEDPRIFEVFEAFVYSGRIHCQVDGDEYVDEEGDTQDKEYRRLGEIWLLGDRLQASAFKDAVVDALIEKVTSEKAVPTLLFRQIYAQSVGSSPMKALLVDMALWGWDTGDLEEIGKEDSSKDFFVDLAIKQRRHIEDGCPDGGPYEGKPTCAYHEHGDDKPCYKTLFG